MTDTSSSLAQAPIAQLANACIRDWKARGTISKSAIPYLSAMLTLQDMSSSYGCDDAKTIVLYFLSNASGWRGENAKAIKAELNRRVKGA